jgi:S1-C subfamily serine protease
MSTGAMSLGEAEMKIALVRTGLILIVLVVMQSVAAGWTHALAQAIDDELRGKIYEEINKSLVGIQATGKEKGNSSEATEVKTTTTKGMGFFVSKDGYILTSHHLIASIELNTAIIDIKLSDRQGKKGIHNRRSTQYGFAFTKNFSIGV